MNVETAIKTAIEYENRVLGVYADAVKQVDDPVGRNVVKVLAREEQHHVTYLNDVLAEWQQTGKISTETLETVIPSRKAIANAAGGLQAKLAERDRDTELELLRRALEVETDTSDFYQQMVAQLPTDVQPLFARFLEIEQGHRALVQAEIDSVSGMGFWFDMPEFDLEAGG